MISGGQSQESPWTIRLALGAFVPGIAVALVVAALLASHLRISPAALPGVGLS